MVAEWRSWAMRARATRKEIERALKLMVAVWDICPKGCLLAQRRQAPLDQRHAVAHPSCSAGSFGLIALARISADALRHARPAHCWTFGRRFECRQTRA